VDDFLLFGNDPAALWRWKTAIEQRMSGLRLAIHPGAQPRPVEEGFPFLGFVVYPQRRRLKRRKGIHFQRKLRRLFAQWATGEILFEQVDASVQGWINYVRSANTVGLRKAVLGLTLPPDAK
jgi:hypothetical protein